VADGPTVDSGDPAPPFRLHGIGPRGADRYRLAEFIQHGGAVVAFPPVRSRTGFGDVEWLQFQSGLSVVLVVPGGDAERRSGRPNVPVLADEDGAVADAYDVPARSGAVFLVDPTRTIRNRWSVPDEVGSADLTTLNRAIRRLATERNSA
jgi:hypothetical protein